MFNLKKIAPATFEIPKEKGMLVPGLLIANTKLLEGMDIEKPLEQVKNVAHLKGILGHSIAMPDFHWGYGFPIGGVAAMSLSDGVISPGGVGYDINCGVRLAIVPLMYKDLKEKTQQALLEDIFQNVPSGVGKGTKNKSLSNTDYQHLLTKGASWSIEKGFGFARDLEHTESLGTIEEADPSLISSHAMERGKTQLGTIGSGNHFIEIGSLEKIISQKIAKKWNLEEGLIYVMIHSGSRGFGHQVCQDTLNTLVKEGYAEGLPDKQLVAAPLQSVAGKNYLASMAAAANFAFNNRQYILHAIRQSFHRICGVSMESIELLYDVCHNIAKFETHGDKKICVHRKGATRAYGPGSKELSSIFQETGQPVLVPGDMGRASYLLAGLGNPLTWCSCCHGAGRFCSRVQSKKSWEGRNTITYMQKQGVTVLANSKRTIAEEMPDAYKNIEDVVSAVQEAKLAQKIVRLRPHLVIKG